MNRKLLMVDFKGPDEDGYDENRSRYNKKRNEDAIDLIPLFFSILLFLVMFIFSLLMILIMMF